ncbi:DUF6527 family protein [Fulvivirga lutea]|uniref:Uncharacterized protein n=1 Tax=Fulvivirga lutea TaxID=2810512 RepID=A0A975A073_9BACT|nr:DUF6527 family protein [Fulvivirga lutea]QSE96506.1 hypothetical protein JR347_12965 [Fulvivirga lutea]
MPSNLEPGILYLSNEYNVAGHLCACGCGNKVITPLGSTEWTYFEKEGKPSLKPSIGNWQLQCRSHYWIRNGNIFWSGQWTDEEIKEGWKNEELRRQQYFAKRNRNQTKKSILRRIIDWLFN